MELTTTFIILLITILLFISGKIRADLVALLSLLALVLFGIISTEEALAGFANSTVIMLAGLFVVGGGIIRTGLAQKGSQFILRYAGSNETKLFVLLMIVVAIIGSFISNTGTVAIMLPIVIGIALSMKVSTSKFLIPLAFAANLSGFMTLISTPTNLLVSQTLEANGYEGLRFFSITPIGIIAFIIGLSYLLLVRNTLLPKDKQKQVTNNKRSSPNTLIQRYHLNENLHRIYVPENSSIVNKKLKELKLTTNYHLVVLKIKRKTNEGIQLLPSPTQQEMAGPNSIIEAHDILYVQGTPMQIAKFAVDYELEIEKHNEHEQLVSNKIGVVEALLQPNSTLINKTVGVSAFRKKYNLNIIGINRKGEFISENISDVRLRFGDALLIQGKWEDIEFLANDTSDVVVVGKPTEIASQAAANGKAPIAAGILLLMIMLMVFNVFPTVVSVMIAAILMVLTGCLRNMDDAYGQINWQSIILIGAMLPWSTALENTGGMTLISNGIIDLLGDLGPIGVLAGLYVVATLFGQIMSNTATTVLFAPIAMNAAIEMGVSPYPMLMSVGVAACMAFSTPFSSPTNALVMTAGNYKFMDFFKVGLPLTLIMAVVMIIVIPFLFPF
ncbi:SLC13 family permease [Pallidibacillus pasinlerensis]|uniref:SLC13 family permease n=1 Tax=Pallidibacillus pasinlerensis TaxID=2703818 RepID=A0ABX0A2W1_9BACI|nr:SLC13 family permease [Pallidibacillus pasinlerensis]NCU17776.1 SLC13 family permease [Pallidibacillus pasinlerensis]